MAVIYIEPEYLEDEGAVGLAITALFSAGGSAVAGVTKVSFDSPNQAVLRIDDKGEVPVGAQRKICGKELTYPMYAHEEISRLLSNRKISHSEISSKESAQRGILMTIKVVSPDFKPA